MRVEIGELRGVAAGEAAEMYLRGRAASTIATYGPAYKKVAAQGEVVGRSVVSWGAGEMASLVMGTTENGIKAVCAIVSLVFEVMGRASPTQK